MVGKAPFASPPSRGRRYPAGFSLIELVVVVAVVAVLATIAVPSYTQLIANNRVRSTAQSFQAALMKARSEALKRNTSITVRRAGASWSAGWEIADTAPDPDLVIEQGRPAARVTLTEASNLTSIQYASSGRLSTAGAAVSMRLEDVGGKASDRCVSVDLTGRPSIDDDC